MTYVYPAIFTPYTEKEDDERYVLVYFPDIPIHTEGDNTAHAMIMAKDALEMMLADYEDCDIELPKPSNPESLIGISASESVPADDSFVTMVVADTDEWRKQNDNRAVRKNLSIPAWLNHKAEQANAPFSQLLQNALMDYLNINPQTIR